MATVSAIIAWLIANWGSVSVAAGAVVTAISMIVRLTPTKNDDKVLDKILPFISFLHPDSGFKVPFTPAAPPIMTERTSSDDEPPTASNMDL